MKASLRVDTGLPEKRTEILYSRITPVNKQFIEGVAEAENVSESALVNHLLNLAREQNARNPKKSLRSS